MALCSLAIALVIVGAAAVRRAIQAPAAAPAGAQKGSDVASRAGPVPVEVATITARRFRETLSATGTLLARESVELQAEADGRVVQIGFREGARVRAGELLVKLNDAELRAGLERALRRQELAAVREKRLAPLVREHLVTLDEYDIVRSEMLVQDADVALIRAQIEKTEIRAPFDGIVGLRHVSEGAFVSASTRVATLQQIERLKVDFSLPERYASRVAIGQAVTFRVAGSQREHSGQVYAIEPRVDVATRTILVRALCDNAAGLLLPGSFANLQLQVAEIPDALLVPAQAVEPGVDGKVVYVVEHGIVHRRIVQTGNRTASEVEVIEGLAPGEQIVVSGLQLMGEGVEIRALPATTSAPPEHRS